MAAWVFPVFRPFVPPGGAMRRHSVVEISVYVWELIPAGHAAAAALVMAPLGVAIAALVVSATLRRRARAIGLATVAATAILVVTGLLLGGFAPADWAIDRRDRTGGLRVATAVLCAVVLSAAATVVTLAIRASRGRPDPLERLRRARVVRDRAMGVRIAATAVVFFAALAIAEKAAEYTSLAWALKFTVAVYGGLRLLDVGLVGAVAHRPSARRNSPGNRTIAADSRHTPATRLARNARALALLLLAAFLLPVVWTPGRGWHDVGEPWTFHASWSLLRPSDPTTWTVLAAPLLAILAWAIARRPLRRPWALTLAALSAAALPALWFRLGGAHLSFERIVPNSLSSATTSTFLYAAAVAVTGILVGNRWLRDARDSGVARLVTALAGAALLVALLAPCGPESAPWIAHPMRDATASRLWPLVTLGALASIFGVFGVAAAIPPLASGPFCVARSLTGRLLVAFTPIAMFATAALHGYPLDAVAAATFSCKVTGLAVGALGLLGIGLAVIALRDEPSDGAVDRPLAA